MIILSAQIEPPTQYYIVASERLDADVEVVVFECHSNVEYPGFDASCSPHSGSFLIDPLSASLKIVSTC